MCTTYSHEPATGDIFAHEGQRTNNFEVMKSSSRGTRAASIASPISSSFWVVSYKVWTICVAYFIAKSTIDVTIAILKRVCDG